MGSDQHLPWPPGTPQEQKASEPMPDKPEKLSDADRSDWLLEHSCIARNDGCPDEAERLAEIAARLTELSKGEGVEVVDTLAKVSEEMARQAINLTAFSSPSWERLSEFRKVHGQFHVALAAYTNTRDAGKEGT